MGVFGANNAAAEGRTTLNHTVCQCQCTHTHLCVFITITFESKPYHFQSTSLNLQDCKQSSKQSNNMTFCGRQTKVHILSWTHFFFTKINNSYLNLFGFKREQHDFFIQTYFSLWIYHIAGSFRLKRLLMLSIAFPYYWFDDCNSHKICN